MIRRVLFMISSMRGGGSERQTLMLLKHLDRSLFSPHLYVMEKAGDLLAQVPADVPIHSFEDARKEPLVYMPGGVMRQQIQHLKKLLADESIEVIYDRTFHMTMIAGPASRQRNIPRVSTIVSPPELALPLVEKRFVRMKQHRLAKAYRESRQIIAVSQIAAESAENFYQLPSQSVTVLPNPVDTQALLQTTVKTNMQHNPSALTLVCVGRMTEEKGHRDLIDAIAIAQANWPDSNPSLHIHLIGDGPLQAELELRAKKIREPHSVKFFGALSDVGTSIANADALILPSLFEGMPNVVLEAMALETPVIATRAGGTIELEREEQTILWAEPQNAESLAAAILSFGTDPKSSVPRTQAATRLIAQHHNIETTCHRLEQYLLAACH
ncbi:glycosyltransferase [bacterium]|jgi:glycosyltransferase involved in cell wall biosynthesis|nr:glycosyltransferase [bacterium]MDB4664383.1 glycosyltransferase [bacterium]